MRLLSCSMTTDQVRDRTKTVTRRLGWWRADVELPRVFPGDKLRLVEKAMGLRRGEHVNVLAVVTVVSVTRERLRYITDEDVAREGFPEWTSERFIEFFLAGHTPNDGPDTMVTRIEWRYDDEGEVGR